MRGRRRIITDSQRRQRSRPETPLLLNSINAENTSFILHEATSELMNTDDSTEHVHVLQVVIHV